MLQPRNTQVEGRILYFMCLCTVLVILLNKTEVRSQNVLQRKSGYIYRTILSPKDDSVQRDRNTLRTKSLAFSQTSVHVFPTIISPCTSSLHLSLQQGAYGVGPGTSCNVHAKFNTAIIKSIYQKPEFTMSRFVT